MHGRSSSHPLRLSALCAALALAGAAFAQGPAAGYEQRRAEVVRAVGTRPLADARAGSPQQAVAAVLGARGRDAATLAAMRSADSRSARAGMTHVRFEQSVDGLAVYGAYAKAAFDRNGGLVQVIDHLARVPAGSLPAVRVDAAQALRITLARLYPTLGGNLPVLAASGGTTRFDGGAFFHEAPSVSAVAVPLADGSMVRGWLVQTWTQSGNMLHHTLVGGDGRVLNVEQRTQSDSYNVFTVDPVASPQAVVAGPGAGNAQSPAGWLTGRSEKQFRINGNNVDTYIDADANNRPDAAGTAVRGGNFLTAADLTVQPTTSVDKTVAVQNLFYLNNRVHDILYSHGFTEAGGNFQVNNFGKGGLGNDAVKAEAQDGSGVNNANFATPSDGSAPRMQMYLWVNKPTDEVVVTSPISARYPAIAAQFSPPLTTTGIAGSIVQATPADGCTPIGAAVAGKIALIDRGTCAFTVKAQNALNAGAKAMIVANNTGGDAVFAMGGTSPKFTSLMVSQNSGVALKALAAPAATLRTLPANEQPLRIDAALDSDVVFHEYGHGLTWRMIGNMSGPISGAIGEGASDGVAMLINGNDVVGTYSSESPNGIRRYPYAGYPLTYADVNGGEVHNDGEIYAAVVWRLIELFGPSRRGALFDLYVDAMNFTPAGPHYEDMRDGMLASVASGPTPSDRCTVWSAFAQFGIGVGASAVINADQTVTTSPSFAKPADCP